MRETPIHPRDFTERLSQTPPNVTRMVGCLPCGRALAPHYFAPRPGLSLSQPPQDPGCSLVSKSADEADFGFCLVWHGIFGARRLISCYRSTVMPKKEGRGPQGARTASGVVADGVHDPAHRSDGR